MGRIKRISLIRFLTFLTCINLVYSLTVPLQAEIKKQPVKQNKQGAPSSKTAKKKDTSGAYSRILGSCIVKKEKIAYRLSLLHVYVPPNEKIDKKAVADAKRFAGKKDRPFISSFNHAFLLVRSKLNDALDSPNSKVIWVSYGGGYVSEFLFKPPNDYSGDVVWMSEKEEIYIILAKSRQIVLTYRVFSPKLNKIIADYPLKLNGLDRSKWPAPSSKHIFKITLNLYQEKYMGSAKYPDGLEQTDCIAEKKTILIVGTKRQREKAPTLYFRFDPKLKKWSDVELKESPIKNKEQKEKEKTKKK